MAIFFSLIWVRSFRSTGASPSHGKQHPELDYLAKRLDSFDDGEVGQFQAMAHRLNLAEIKDFINLTFCCQQATVISDFSKLEQTGQDHYTITLEKLMQVDAAEQYRQEQGPQMGKLA